jgi:hypothetical protein
MLLISNNTLLLYNRKNLHKFYFFNYLSHVASLNSSLKNIIFYYFILTSIVVALSQFNVAQF